MWLEIESANFTARHDERDAQDAAIVLDQLEEARTRYLRLLEADPGELAVVLHSSRTQMDLAQPWLPLQRLQTANAGRRYLVGWCTRMELHVLAPRVLAGRASNAPGSLEMLMLAPSALLARRFLAARIPGLPPPFGPASFLRWMHWAWLVEGSAQWFSGQNRHSRPAVVARLREGKEPSFPPGRRDAPLLAGTVFDLLEREEGRAACVALASGLHRHGATAALEDAFRGRPIRHTEATWRAHLERLVETDDRPSRRGR